MKEELTRAVDKVEKKVLHLFCVVRKFCDVHSFHCYQSYDKWAHIHHSQLYLTPSQQSNCKKVNFTLYQSNYFFLSSSFQLCFASVLENVQLYKRNLTQNTNFVHNFDRKEFLQKIFYLNVKIKWFIFRFRLLSEWYYLEIIC